MPDNNLEYQVKKTYLKAIENSVGSRIFNINYVKNLTTNEVYDVMNNGLLSCAYFVSGLLTIFSLIDRPHAVVTTVTEKLKETGWEKQNNNKVKPGDVIVWEKLKLNGSVNEHIGFVLDDQTAVSNSSEKQKIASHHITYGINDSGKPNRKIIEIYRYSKF